MRQMEHRNSRRFIDLSHPVVSGMAVAAGLPKPRIEPYLSHAASRTRYEGRAEFEITRLFFVGNTGTTIDSPYHRYPNASDVAALPLESVVGLEGVCIDLGRRSAEGADASQLGAKPLSGRAVLIRTGWDRRWGTREYWTAGPFLNAEFAERLVEERPSIIGVDFANVDDPRNLARPVHSTLLAAGIPILEHLRGLDRLPQDGFRLFAAPVAVQGASAMPVRVYADLRESATAVTF